ncbi:hypothetical protein [Streptomyces bikiniensis]|uniref:hypothetical protein n=1 Tax=Streptomyces bikiniensis TaxID=1896 RepID=UPI000689D7B6
MLDPRRFDAAVNEFADALARDLFAAAFVRVAPDTADWPPHPDEVPGCDSDPLWGRLGRASG